MIKTSNQLKAKVRNLEFDDVMHAVKNLFKIVGVCPGNYGKTERR